MEATPAKTRRLLDPVAALAAGILAFLLTGLATIYPAWRASRVEPAEALRYE